MEPDVLVQGVSLDQNLSGAFFGRGVIDDQFYPFVAG
jgi:hypothetical protein